MVLLLSVAGLALVQSFHLAVCICFCHSCRFKCHVRDVSCVGKASGSGPDSSRPTLLSAKSTSSVSGMFLGRTNTWLSHRLTLQTISIHNSEFHVNTHCQEVEGSQTSWKLKLTFKQAMYHGFKRQRGHITLVWPQFLPDQDSFDVPAQNGLHYCLTL